MARIEILKRLAISPLVFTQPSSAGKIYKVFDSWRFVNVGFRHRTWPARLTQANGATGRPNVFFNTIDSGTPELEVSDSQEQEYSREWVIPYPIILPAFRLQNHASTEGSLYELAR